MHAWQMALLLKSNIDSHNIGLEPSGQPTVSSCVYNLLSSHIPPTAVRCMSVELTIPSSGREINPAAWLINVMVRLNLQSDAFRNYIPIAAFPVGFGPQNSISCNKVEALSLEGLTLLSLETQLRMRSVVYPAPSPKPKAEHPDRPGSPLFFPLQFNF